MRQGEGLGYVALTLLVEQTGSSVALSVLAIAIRDPATGRERLGASIDTRSPASGSLPDAPRTHELHRQIAHAAAQSRYREHLRDPFTSVMWTIYSGL